MLKQMVPGDE